MGVGKEKKTTKKNVFFVVYEYDGGSRWARGRREGCAGVGRGLLLLAGGGVRLQRFSNVRYGGGGVDRRTRVRGVPEEGEGDATANVTRSSHAVFRCGGGKGEPAAETRRLSRRKEIKKFSNRKIKKKNRKNVGKT